MAQKNPLLHLFSQTLWLLLSNNGFCEEYKHIIFPLRWCIQSVFGIYQEAGRLLTFTCYITFICVLCISYVCATQNGISIILITCSLWSVVCFLCWQFLLSLTTLSLRAVDSSKVVGGLPWEEMSEVFAQTWDKLFSRSRVQDKHSKVSSMPAALYLGPHIITGQQQLLTTTEKSQWQFSGLYISFFSRRRHCLTEGWCEQVCAIFHGHWLRGGSWLDGEGHTW